MKVPFYKYSDYLKSIFGQKVYKLSIDGGFTCPNIDGTVARGGCSYCNNRSFVPDYVSRRDAIEEQIDQGIRRQQKRSDSNHFLGYLQAFSNTYAPVEELEPLYRQILDHPRIIGLVIGTRPDCLPEPVIELLTKLARVYYIGLEIGIESIYDDTLERVNRGHNFRAVIDAMESFRNTPVHLGTHIMLGFPGESYSQWMHEADVVSELPIEYLKLHHLMVIRGTQMAREYREDPFMIFSYDEWIKTAADFIERLHPDIALARLAAEAPDNLLIAPDWGTYNHGTIMQKVSETLRKRNTRQGSRYRDSHQVTF